MTLSRFYGAEKNDTITYLEFGEIDLRKGKKKVWDFRLHQKAYDWLMLGRYANDIIAYHSMSELLGESDLEQIAKMHEDEIHHEDETTLSLSKLIALYVSGKDKERPSFFELGQTIFGCIEGMEFASKLLSLNNIDTPPLDLTEVQWYGLDISEMFNKLSIVLHGDYRVVTDDDFKSLPAAYDVFFAKGITLLYAVRSIDQLLEIIGKGRCSIFDYSFSLGEERATTIGSGKSVQYLSIDRFLESYEDRGRKMYVRTDKSYYNESNNSVFIDCVYADNSVCKEFIAADTQIRSDLREKLAIEPGMLAVFDLDSAEVPGWVSLEEFVAGIRRQVS